jgi:hypothetical protein
MKQHVSMHSIIAFFRKWWFGLVLGFAYLAIFNLWQIVNREWIILSSLTVSLALFAVLALAARRHYFLNRWDTLLHASVILDILLEGTLIPEHQNRGFYFCALGFAIVIGFYRFYLRRRSLLSSSS